jgi:uroporphyrin-III C-methyltransferase
MTANHIESSTPETEPAPVAPAPKPSRAPLLSLIAVVLIAALSALFWVDVRQRLEATQEELARRLRDIEADSRDARTTAGNAEEALRDAQAKIGQLEGRLSESQNQQLALEALYQELSRTREEWQLAEIEQVLAIASQQLQLAGNVRAALLALQVADGRLAGNDRPQFAPVRQALGRDIERLQSLPMVDFSAMSRRLGALAASVDGLPLAHDERSERPATAPDKPAEAGQRGFWARLRAEVWSELKDLVVVRRFDGAEPPLLAPSHAYFLKENLRLRLLNARLSLLARDEASFQQDLRVAQAWIRRYFDVDARQTADALRQLEQLASTPITLEMPDISESLNAVRAFKTRRERKP